MTVDPVDDRTFWFTTEYYTSTGGSWQTRIGSFKFPNAPSPQPDTQSVTADSCNSNGMIDPNESVTVSLGIKNTGPIATSNLVATLQATGGVTGPSGPQNYGAIAPGASTAMSFTFTAGNLACGTPLVATLQLQDGATSFGTITYTLTVGSPSGSTTASYSSGKHRGGHSRQQPRRRRHSDQRQRHRQCGGCKCNRSTESYLGGDLQLSLVAPDNTTIPLVANRGSSGDNFGTGNNDCSGTPTTFDDQASTAISAGTPPYAATFKTGVRALGAKWQEHHRHLEIACRRYGGRGCRHGRLFHRSNHATNIQLLRSRPYSNPNTHGHTNAYPDTDAGTCGRLYQRVQNPRPFRWKRRVHRNLQQQ